jgi:lysozyme
MLTFAEQESEFLRKMDSYQLRQDLIRDEGFRAHVYQDTEGFWTIGYGFLVDRKRGGLGLPPWIADLWLDELIADKVRDLRQRWPRLDEQAPEVQRALANMAYQLGPRGVMNFRRMIAALEAGDRARAAAEALDSTWARQTPNRARRVAALIRGEI